MKTKPCAVCGETNTKLIDGFYYCTECGTQDVNTQETVVDTVFLDGTVNLSSKWKVKTALKETTQMSREWKKWHAFNFIMLGLVQQLMDLGASSGFKDQVLWIWTRYMNMFMVKDEMEAIAEDQLNLNKSIFMDIDENDNQQRDDKSENYEKQDENKQNEMKKLKKSVEKFTSKILLSILYLGLLFDRSSIQLYNLVQFILEKRLSFFSCLKFIPKELDITGHPDIVKFRYTIRGTKLDLLGRSHIEAMSLVKVLDLGIPSLPDVREMVESYVTELCLPNSFKNLVLSLFLHCPSNQIEIDETNAAAVVRLPHYEAEVMGYILIALKMCFGLDDDYEIKVADAVEKINDTENRLKSYKLGMHSDPTNRLFSFREWSTYLQYRHMVMCKQYLPLAVQHNLETDDCIFMEHLDEKLKKPIKLMDEITMDILNKIPPMTEGQVIPKSEFAVSLTRLSSYTEVVTRYIQDPEVKLLLSEDFTQYSLSYACKDLKLVINIFGKMITGGVTNENKVFNKNIVGKMNEIHCDRKKVYVRNCENKNWFKTNPPNIEHITELDEGTSNKDTEDGYDFNSESKLAENQVSTTEVETLPESIKDTAVTYEQEYVLENIQEEKECISIFDDPFDDEVASATHNTHNFDTENDTYNESFEFWAQLRTKSNEKKVDLNNETSLVEAVYNPETFDRASVINELLLHACKKYKITIPIDLKRNMPNRPTKRPRNKPETITMNKKPKVGGTYHESRMFMQRVMVAYNASIEKKILNEVSEHVKSFAEMTHLDNAATQENQPTNVCGDVPDDIMNTDDNEDVDKSKDIGTMEVDNETSALGDTGKEEVDDVDSSPNSPKVNPDFDEKTHDVKQLYIKCRDRLQFEDIFDINDPEIEKVLEKKILEYRDNKIATSANKLSQQQHDDERPNVLSDSDSDDTSSLEDEINDDDINNLPKLINRPGMTRFGYWIRYYKTPKFIKNTFIKDFEKEATETMPKSFVFVLEQCASIIHCTPLLLYKRMMYLENLLFTGKWSRRPKKKKSRRNKKRSTSE